jgi:hypothetical protein
VLEAAALRSMLHTLTLLGLCVALAVATDDKEKTKTEKTNKHQKEVKIVKVDPEQGNRDRADKGQDGDGSREDLQVGRGHSLH